MDFTNIIFPQQQISFEFKPRLSLQPKALWSWKVSGMRSDSHLKQTPTGNQPALPKAVSFHARLECNIPRKIPFPLSTSKIHLVLV